MSMMQSFGTVFLSKSKPLATTAADGTFVLTLHAYDRQGTHMVESWRVVYSGTPAKDFWQQHKDSLVPGTPIALQAHRMRAQKAVHSPEFLAYATHIALAPLARQSQQAHATGAAPTTPQAPTTQPHEGTYESV